MRARDEWRDEQERAIAVYDTVKAQLMGIPGVVDVGVGIKEIGGHGSDVLAFRVYVAEKLPASSVPPGQAIPPAIAGFATDVLRTRKPHLALGFNDENDEKNYKTKVGGSSIGIDTIPLTGSHRGTLGCFAELSDHRVVILTNYHVLAGGLLNALDHGLGVGQPDHSGSLCCDCNEIATVLDGDPDLDCGIALLKSNVPFAPKIRRIKRPDGTVEQEGIINGSGHAISGDPVWKVGAKSGLTRGTLFDAFPGIEVHVAPPFPIFFNQGDSGSVVVSNVTGEVVGLLYGNAFGDHQIGLGYRIAPILSRLGISILPTDTTRTYEESARDADEERIGVTGAPSPELAFAALADRLRMSDTGSALLDLVQRHRRECGHLVNHDRGVKVAWHRAQGPTWLAALMRSARERSYAIPEAFDGVSRTDAIARFRSALAERGSETLRADLDLAGDLLMTIFANCATAGLMIEMWEREAASILTVRTGA